MPDLDALIRSQVRGYTRTPGVARPDLGGCQVIEKVAPTSPAGWAGLTKGDLLVSIDGRPAAEVDSDLAAVTAVERRFEVVTTTNERVALATTGVDIGVLLRPTAEAVTRSFSIRG